MSSSDSRTAMFEQRYFHPGETHENDVWDRVASFWSTTPAEYEAFGEMMSSLDALPNTPAIANAGKPVAQGSACFVLNVEDSLYEGEESIARTLGEACRIQATGGGTGFSFSKIRPKGSLINSTQRPSPMGPVGVLEMYSETIGRITQGSVRFGANMGALDVDHPDILEFIRCKNQEFEESWAEEGLQAKLREIAGSLNGSGPKVLAAIDDALAEYYGNRQVQGKIHNFNISVGATDDFMRRGRFQEGRELWEEIVRGAWLNGEPGLLFLDKINAAAPHPELIKATNPCGEVPLLPNEACVLGSVNLENHMIDWGGIYVMDYRKLERTVRTLTRMLDNIIDKQNYPLDKIRQTHHRYRKIGVGIMGLANAFIRAGVVYGSPVSVTLAGEWMKFVQQISWDESERLGAERGFYPGYDLHPGLPARRNIVCQVVAPTGSISRLAKTSFGIEPNFAKVQESYILGSSYIDEHPLRDDPHFITTDEVSLEQHIDMLCEIQKYTDQAVSKTCNAPESTSIEDVEAAYTRSYEGGAKGITILRKGGRQKVVLKDHSGKHDLDNELPTKDESGKYVCVDGFCEL